MPPEFEQSSFDRLLDNWDRAAFGMAMRRIEVLILRGRDQLARDVFESLLRRESRAKPTMQSHLTDVLPNRIVRPLEGAGYECLADVARAADEQLLAIRDIGPDTLDFLKLTISRVAAGEPLPLTETELAPEWDVELGPSGDGRIVCSCARKKGDCQVNTENTGAKAEANPIDELSKAIDLFAKSSEQTLAAIDLEIATVTGRLEVLRRMRRMLVAGPAASTVGAAKRHDELAKRMVDALQEHGRMRAKELAELVGDGNYTLVGRIAARRAEFVSQGGLIRLAS